MGPKINVEWKVHEHGPIRELEENLWLVSGEIPGLPMPLRRTMTLLRLADGRVAIHGGIPLDDGSMRRLEAWGEPALLVVPNGWHRIDAPAYKKRYPQLRVLCPAGASQRVSEVVPVDGAYDAFPKDPLIAVETLEGTRMREGVFVVRSAARASLVFNDLFFNQAHLPGFWGFVYRAIGSTGSPRVTWLARTAMVEDRGALAAHLQRLSVVQGLARLVPGHGEVVEQEAPAVLLAVSARLLGLKKPLVSPAPTWR